MSSATLVSIVMPTYKFEYFEEALDSVLGQTYPELELIICDDSEDGRIAALVEEKRASAAFPIRYHRNDTRLGELGSTAKGIRLAEGEYVKFLHDDDVLQPDCVEALVGVMEREPNVVLASSRRLRIDEEGQRLPDILATCFPFAGDVLIDGRELVSFLADHTINFIGEPSCIMARRGALLPICDQLMILNGRHIHWVGDLAMCAQLLQRGDLAFLSRPLTRFRVSRQQFSQIGRDQPGIGEKGHEDFRLAIRELGWYRQSGDNRFVRSAPITRLSARLFKPVNLLAALQRAAGFGSVTLSTWLEARRPEGVQQALIDRHLEEQGGGPRLAVLIIDARGDAEGVERTLASLEGASLYRNVETCLFSPEAGQRSGAIAFDPAVGPATAVNQVLARLEADWLVLVEAGVEFTPSGLLVAALDLLAAPENCQAVYADELMRLDDGELGAALRPDLNLDLLLSFPAGLSRHWLFRREPLLATGGFDETAGEAFELAYQLRLVEQQGLGCIGHISEPLLAGEALRLHDSAAERAAIEGHLRARGYAQATVGSRLPGRYELDYGHAGQPSVSILVLAGERLAQLQRCVETVLENTAYPNYEILLLEQGGEAADLREWLLAVEGMGVEQVRVLRGDGQLSRAALRNLAASRARGEFLLWLDAGSGILDKGWLQQLLNHGQRPEVGAVGAKLLAADGRVCHAGWLLGLCGPAGRAFEGRSHEDAGYLQRLQVDQNYSAVGGECLLMRRELFLELGGFDEALTRWDDVDLCLRAVQAGYLNVWTPRARLLLDAPAASAASVEEEDALYARWLPLLARDPAYNPGFSLQAEGGFKLADPQLAWRPLQAWRPLPTVLAHPADLFGCGHYRVIQPFSALRESASIDGALSIGLMHVADLERYDPDVVVLQRQVGEERLEAMRRMQAFSRAFKVYELDDYLPNVPLKSAHRQHLPKDILRTLRRGLGYVDRFVVSTPALAEAFDGLHPDIRVIENRLPVGWWQGLRAQRRRGERPRVGWAGGSSHTGDLELIADVVRELADEVDWVFFGMCPPSIRPFVREVHAGVPIERYPRALAALDLDLALAPVEQNLFNECKSNLRLLEYGACGFPVVCSDVRCYQDDLPVTRVKNRFRDWVEAIRLHTRDLDAAARAGDALRERVLADWMLEGDHLRAWRQAWMPD
ncbi:MULTISPECIES: glycosyltransferase [Pseudomonas aeruginosa group]|nr:MULTISPECIES: glycosyltransferase [Pseudomonas aeruginosa group]KSD68815.1 O-antigen biosynthesis protein [Pseudomonas aeruginosa]MCT9628845.1 glycosyltransferase [Pseudomonas aeruginosa]MCW8028323.1 glycosyltransferase [Pseudomonas aeruginosa]MCW8036157.1 glycosyltransferase [Pseudomonas aeruginosa]MDK2349148.1 glycosyltransferase [Pseudomonas paraeruginosa]